MKHYLHNSLRALFLSLAVLLSLPMMAAVEVEIDGINYDLIPKGKVATVIKKSNGWYSGEVVIPETVEYNGTVCNVTSIEWGAFSDCSGLTSVTIPNSVKSIGHQAFEDCSGLTSVTIGSGVEYIGYEAFANCPELLDVYCYAEKVPSTESDAFNGSYTEYVTLHVPAGSIESYKVKTPWRSFGKIVGLSAEGPEVEKCATPVVTYADGKLSMSCETEGAEFVTKITSNDFSTFNTSEIELSATYNIEVYATKANFENSDTVDVALVWVENGEVSDENAIINIEARPVLIQGNAGTLNISGVTSGTEISIYTISGTEVARATATEGTTTISTGLQSGTIAIVKFGNKSVKVRI